MHKQSISGEILSGKWQCHIIVYTVGIASKHTVENAIGNDKRPINVRYLEYIRYEIR